MRDFLISILQSYEKNGESELASKKLTQYVIARYGSVLEAQTRLGLVCRCCPVTTGAAVATDLPADR